MVIKLRNSWIIVLITLLLGACNTEEDSAKSANSRSETGEDIPAVQAVKARYGALPLDQRLTGTVRAENQVGLYPEISARVEKVMVENGDGVEKGEPLVKLNDRTIREQLSQARSNLNINQARLQQAKASFQELKNQYDRQKKLYEKELISVMEIESLKAQLESARADVNLAEAQVEQSRSQVEEQEAMLEQTIIRSPINGTVGQRNAQPGMMAGTNTQLFIVGDLSKLRIEVILTDEMLSYIKKGQTARVYATNDMGDEVVLDGEISRISPFLNNTSRSTEADIDIDNEDGLLSPGMFVPVDILYGESRNATLVPKSALYDNPRTGETGIYVAKSIGVEVEPVKSVNPDSPPPLTDALPVSFVPVDIIASGRMDVAVEGIEEGQWVITIGQDMLSGDSNKARIRTVAWERILALQNMQRQDLLQSIMGNGNQNSQQGGSTSL